MTLRSVTYKFRKFSILDFRMMSCSESSGFPISCHPLTSSPNAAWDELKSNQTVKNIQPLPPDLPVSSDAIRFVCMADTHSLTSRLQFPIPPGNVFLHAGDFTRRGAVKEVEDFNKFLGSLPHKHKIVIAGNHELTFDPSCNNSSSMPQRCKFGPSVSNILDKRCDDVRDHLTNCLYLEDSASEVYGLTVYGSPWQPEFNNWAFNLPRGEALLKMWNRIPSNIDVLLTHGPPIGHGDLTFSGLRAGCVELLLSVQQRVKPKYHVFGHIHEGYGITTDGQTVFVNCSTCNLHYQPVNYPIIFDIPVITSKKL